LPFLEDLTQRVPASGIVPISALQSDNLDRLVDLIGSRLPVSPPLFASDVVTDRDEPFHAAEIVREKLTLKLREELPYGINVQIERFVDENNRLMINAVIWVERAGQKAIVIGQGGERLKEIGRLARIELNDLWQRSVHLELWVKVKENWADSENGAAPVRVRHIMRSLGQPSMGRRLSARHVWLATSLRFAPIPLSRHTAASWRRSPATYGRLTLFARGANGPKSTLRGVRRPFQRMLVSWSGKGEACQLVSAENRWSGDQPRAKPADERILFERAALEADGALRSASEIFFSYAWCVQALCDGEIEEPTLRRFEKRLLNDLGYGLELAKTGDGVPVERDGYYRFALAERAAALRGRGARCGLRSIPGRTCRRRALATPARSEMPSACCARPSIPVSTAAPLKSREVALALRRREPVDRESL